MTIEQLRQVKYLESESESLQEQLKRIECAINSMTSRASGMPHGHTDRVELLNRYISLADRIKNKEREMHEAYIQAVEYICNLEDSQMRQILSYRFLDGYSWIKVGMLMGTNEMAVKQACYRYFDRRGKKNNECNECNEDV